MPSKRVNHFVKNSEGVALFVRPTRAEVKNLFLSFSVTLARIQPLEIESFCQQYNLKHHEADVGRALLVCAQHCIHMDKTKCRAT